MRWLRSRDDRTPDGVPHGWKPTAGAVAALPGQAPSWVVGAGGATAKDWRAAGAAAVRAVRAVDDGLVSPESRSDDEPVDPTADPTADSAVDPAVDPTVDPAVDPTVGPAVDPTVDPAVDQEGPEGDEVVLLRPATPDDAPDDADGWASLATGLVLGSHRFSLRTRARSGPPTLRLPVPDEHRDAVERAIVLARATALARDLADAPSGAKTPAWFAERAVEMVHPAVATTVRDERWLADEGFGGVLAVGGGSSRPPRLLELSWAPPGASTHVVLVGKGITFDTGGISIKANAGMADMRTDCAGGAAVVGALDAIAHLDLPVRVTGLVPLAENHVSGSSYRPGDVVRHRGGTTSEVTNTDAEGRMVLADALVYAAETLAPDAIVDVATLTGAMKTSLGVRTGGVFASEPALARGIVDAGAATGESWWPMPLTDHLDADVDSTIADVRQAPPGPGGIVAALFLRRFVPGDVPWAHMDIAGPARCDSPHEEVAKGATGFAARTLVELCASRM